VTLPGGPGQVNPDAQFGVTGNDGSIPGQAGMDQPTVTDILKAQHVRDSPSIQGPLGIIYNGLRAGISMPLAILENAYNALSDAGEQIFLTVEHATQGLRDLGETIWGRFTEIIIGIGNALDDIPMIGPNLETALLRLFSIRKKTDQNTDALYRGFTGDSSENNSTAAAEGAASAAASTIAAHTAALARLESTGTTLAVSDFSTMPDAATLPSPWIVSLSGSTQWGTWGIKDGGTQFVNSNLTSVNTGMGRDAVGIYSGVVSEGDFHRVGAVYSSVPQTQADRVGRSYLIARGSDDLSSCIMVEFSKSAVELSCYIDNEKTIWQTESHAFKANNAYYLECGVGSNSRQYRVINGDGTVILGYTEVGALSRMGTAYRHAGAAAHATYYDDIFRLPEVGRPARMSLWIFEERL
jgi:hypothetical protein